MADEFGFGKWFQKYKLSTSRVVVIDPSTGDILGSFYNDPTVQDYVDAIDRTKAWMASH